MANIQLGGPFLPPSAKGAIIFPGPIGGGNWGGISYAASLGLVYVNTSNFGEGQGFVDQDHYPCNQPPWGQLTAVNVNTGNIAWQVPLGSYKALEEKGIYDTGTPNLGSSLVTAGGLLFIGATNDHRFRAFDARSGKLLWQIDLDGDALGGPMTYLSRSGKQLLICATGGPSFMGVVGPRQPPVSGKIIAFGLPAGRLKLPIQSSTATVRTSPRP